MTTDKEWYEERANTLLEEAELNYDMWLQISQDEKALHVRNKSQTEAMFLVNYFEGRVDALMDLRSVTQESDATIQIHHFTL